MTQPIAILCSDLHFSHRPPVARSAEPDWYEAMARQWYQMMGHASPEMPIIIAGDIFDVWKSSPELTNFVIGLFRNQKIYAIPGQHDLPNHSYADIYRSSYGTLIEAGVIGNMKQGFAYDVLGDGGLVVFPFPWGFEIEPPNDDYGDVKLAVIHKYVWINGCQYPGAPDTSRLGAYKKQLEGYDAAVFGDNHKGFLKSGLVNVLNCGGFMPRKSDERDYIPHFGLLYEDGEIERVPLDTSEDKWLEPEEIAEVIDRELEMGGMIEALNSVGIDALNFPEMIRHYLEKNGIEPGVRKLITEAVDAARDG